MSRRPPHVAHVLVRRVCAVAAIALIASMVALLAALNTHLRTNAETELNAATDIIDSAGSSRTRTVDQERLLRILPRRAIVAIEDTQGTVRALSDSAVNIERLPLDHEQGSTFEFHSGSHHYMARTIDRPNLAVATTDGHVAKASSILVAIDVSSDRATVKTVAWFALAVAAAALALTGAVTNAVVTRSLRPLATMADAAERLAATGASEPLPDAEYHETRALARSVNGALERRLAAEQAVRDFVADASHELRTPLAKIQGWADLLASGVLDEERSQVAHDAISEATEELVSVVAQLGALAKLDGNAPRVLSLVDLASLAREVTAEATQFAPDIDVSVDAHGEATLLGNEIELRTALRNVIGNAFHHGGTSVTVSIVATSDAVRIDVADNGPGVPAPLRQRVFDRFFTTATGEHSHSGLGLAMVASIVKSHRGSVELSESDAGGALIVMALPRIVSKP